jgi:GNAT superfamily N-acetyltransferase
VAVIRPLRPSDAPVVQGIERHAGDRFRTVGLAHVADDDPFSVGELSEYASGGRGWVATDDDTPIAYAVVDVIDGNAHVEQVSVHPDHQGRGIGRALLDRVAEWARSNGMPAMTLTTFRDVEWNQPLYEHLGFVVMTDDEVGPELVELVAEEAEDGLDPELRSCMRMDLD